MKEIEKDLHKNLFGSAAAVVGLSIFILSVVLVNVGFAQEKWREYKHRNFIIKYKTAPIDFVKSVKQAADQYYSEISANLGFARYQGWTWGDQAEIYIYDDADDYVKNAKTYQWSHWVASPTDRVIRSFPAAHGFFDSTLPHEIAHIIFREFVGFEAQIPPWFEEGVAMNQEKAKRWGSHRDVREALRNGTFIPLDQLTYTRLDSRSDSQLVQLVYAES